MVTLAEEPTPEPTAQDTAERITREVIAGHPEGAVRRIVLYAVMFAAMGIAYYVPPVVVVALVCGILLVSTDSLL
jgi:hypothetical protein